jgi:hypothetical protein
MTFRLTRSKSAIRGTVDLNHPSIFSITSNQYLTLCFNLPRVYIYEPLSHTPRVDCACDYDLDFDFVEERRWDEMRWDERRGSSTRCASELEATRIGRRVCHCADWTWRRERWWHCADLWGLARRCVDRVADAEWAFHIQWLLRWQIEPETI